MSRRLLLVVGHATGGIGEHVSSLALGLPALGWQPQVLTSPLTASRFDLGPDVLPLWPLRSASAWSAARRAARGSDLVHAHGHQAGTVALALTGTLRPAPPVVVSWHNAVLAAGPRARLLELAERWQARRAALVTGASSDLVARAGALGARHAELAPVASLLRSAVAARAAEPDPPLPDLPTGASVVLTVSRVAPQKDLDVLVDAAALVGAATATPPVWLVAGDGDPDLQVTLQRRAEADGVDLRFLGHRRDVPALLARADLFVLASRWEARSLAVQEAMAAGLPIVVTRVGGLPDLVGDAGLTVPARDPRALADAVLRLVGDPAAAGSLGERARQRSALLPTPDQVLADWAGRYLRLTGGSAV